MAPELALELESTLPGGLVRDAPRDGRVESRVPGDLVRDDAGDGRVESRVPGDLVRDDVGDGRVESRVPGDLVREDGLLERRLPGAVVRDDGGLECVLPGGLVGPDGRCMAEAQLRVLTGRDEEWLARNRGVPCAVAVSRLLGACIVRVNDAHGSAELARQLLVGDREYLMLQVRRLTLGDTFSAVLTCPACGARMDVDIPIDDIAIEPRPQASAIHAVYVGGRTLWFRLPTGADQEAVLGLESERAADELLKRCMVDPPPLSFDERLAVVEAMERLAPRVDLELEPTCPECLATFVLEFDTTRFFLDELGVGTDRLLREVHQLAYHYHWSEAAILDLTRARRRVYLSLLADELRPA